MSTLKPSELEDRFGGFRRNGKLLFTGLWPTKPVFDLETGANVTDSITGGSFMDAERISDEEALELLAKAGISLTGD